MLDCLAPLRPTALPALLFLAWLPVFLALPPRWARGFFSVAGVITLVVVGGPWLAGGLVAAIFAGYAVVELAARLPARRLAFALALLLIHAAYGACFYLPLPAAFATGALREADRPGVFLFFSGIALTFLRLVSYLHERLRRGAPRLTLADYLAHMLFFPQFRHGPIERGHAFAVKLRDARRNWQPRDLAAGLARIAAGALPLVVIAPILRYAPRLLPTAFHDDPTAAWSSPAALSLPQVLLLMHLPAVVLYAAESAFASLQLGTARTFGVVGSENFNVPLLARDPREVWHRWNITFSLWLRDYAYIPLGGGRQRKHLNLILVFVYCSLLHGPQWRCLAWGLWTGATLAAYVWLRERFARREATTPRSYSRLLRIAGGIAARLLTFHWFAVGVTIIVDPEYCGVRMLAHYLRLLAALVGL